MDYTLSIALLLLLGLTMSIGILIGMLWSERIAIASQRSAQAGSDQVLIADQGSAQIDEWESDDMDKWWAEIQTTFEKGK
jgi:hypothetical protein